MTAALALLGEIVAELEKHPEIKQRLRQALGLDAEPEVRPPEYLYLSVADWAKMIGISRSKAFEIAAEPGFPLVLSGRARRVDVAAAREWIRTRSKGGAS